MGKKSEKKVKAERVNALRKQYDAFLEEDKKRKERNEYILGKLDNMRYSTTAVQIRHKPIVIGDVMPTIPLPLHRGGYSPDIYRQRDEQAVHLDYHINRPTPHNLQVDVPRTHLDNTSLLREISKKYILIPKLRSSVVNDYIGTIGPQSLPSIAVSSPQSHNTNKEDWQSKYDILEQLKKKEKEEQADNYGNDELIPVKEKQALSPDNIIKKCSDNIVPSRSNSCAMQSYDTKESTTKYEQEPPEKDLDKPKAESESQNVERSKISDNKTQEPNTDQAPISSASANITPKTNVVYETFDTYNLQDQESGIYATVASMPATSENYENSYIGSEYNNTVFANTQQQISDVSQQEQNAIQYEQPIESEGIYPDKENAYLDPEDYSPIQVLNSPAVVEQIDKEPADNAAIGIKEDEVAEYPIEMINVHEFTPKESVKLIDGENINPKHMASEENLEHGYENNDQAETVEETTVLQNTSEIEAFDAEQKEMFYSEETAQYGYDQQQSDTYNQEYQAPAPENEFYESPAALQEQQYIAEINEHEESTARYDPNYEKQYAEQYEHQYQGQEQQQYVQPEGYDQTDQQYVQQEGYDQTDQQYVPPQGYDQADQQYIQPEGYEQSDQQHVQQEGYDQAGLQYQDYEYQKQDQDTVQNIEQVMDNEQGFVDQLNYEAHQMENLAEPIQKAVDQNAS